MAHMDMGWVLALEGLDYKEKAVLTVLTCHASRPKYDTWVSQSTIAREAGFSKNSMRTVRAAIKSLAAKGIISYSHRAVEAGNQTSNLYHVFVGAEVQPVDNGEGVGAHSTHPVDEGKAPQVLTAPTPLHEKEEVGAHSPTGGCSQPQGWELTALPVGVHSPTNREVNKEENRGMNRCVTSELRPLDYSTSMVWPDDWSRDQYEEVIEAVEATARASGTDEYDDERDNLAAVIEENFGCDYSSHFEHEWQVAQKHKSRRGPHGSGAWVKMFLRSCQQHDLIIVNENAEVVDLHVSAKGQPRVTQGAA